MCILCERRSAVKSERGDCPRLECDEPRTTERDPVEPKCAMPKLVELPDRRRLCYAEYGDPRGKPVMLFHGLPGTRIQCRPRAATAEQAGLRWIVADRPGVGQSDYQRGRRIVDWPRDVAHLADHLGIAEFTICGWSGGGPYILAAAAMLSQRVRHAVLVGGIAPMDTAEGVRGMARRDKLLLRAARWTPWLARAPIWLLCLRARRDPAGHVQAFVNTLSPVDARLFDDADFRGMMMSDLGESLRCGHRGVAREIELLARPWGFDLGQVQKRVTLLHGQEDRVTPPHMGRFLAERLPNCDAIFLPGEGHFLMHRLWPHLIRCLVDDRWTGPRGEPASRGASARQSDIVDASPAALPP